ncbi:MAG TPA: DUF4038 domain-containing protein [Pedobacter sp.]|nr:DUF4038 domain-containing protein [Pedobacter sp.]
MLFILTATTVFGQTRSFKFPLELSKDRRHLTDQNGKYFLYNGDTAWMLFLKLTKEEALECLIKRKAQGFNAEQIILTGFAMYNKETPVNRYGQKPFLDENDFSTPNPAYFDHVEWVIKKADSIGMILAIAPLWAGCCGEGWAGQNKPMAINKPEGNFKFGEYLGKRFGKYKHLIWILGGDNDPAADEDNYRQLALGIKAHAPKQLITYHASSSHSSTDVLKNESWLDFSMVYTYFRGFNKAWTKDQPDVYEVSWKEYAKRPIKPFLLGESTYEGEHDAWGSALQARKQAYWAVLGGGIGNAYGSPLWTCDVNWRKHMELPGALSLKHFSQLFNSFQWEKLVPDTNNIIALSGNGTFASNNYATTAMANNGSFSISYMPDPRTLSIDLNRYKSKRPAISWFDPSTGQTTKGKPITGKGVQEFSPPQGLHDWVMIIR